MRSHVRRLGVAAALLAGCVASGTIRGRLTTPGAAPTQVTLHYRSERFGQNGTMSATLPDGESFTGRYLQITSDTSSAELAPYWSGWDIPWSGSEEWAEGSGPWFGGEDVPTFTRNYSGKVIATLLGDRGSRMRCRFRLSEPDQGMSRGGVGECQISGGGKITAEF